jgi:hypothetical protein
MDRFVAVGRWIVIILFALVGLEALSIAIFLLAALLGDYTGWYRIENYMTMP